MRYDLSSKRKNVIVTLPFVLGYEKRFSLLYGLSLERRIDHTLQSKNKVPSLM